MTLVRHLDHRAIFDEEFYLSSAALYCFAMENVISLVTGRPAPKPFVISTSGDKGILFFCISLTVLLLLDAAVALFHLEPLARCIAYIILVYWIVAAVAEFFRSRKYAS